MQHKERHAMDTNYRGSVMQQMSGGVMRRWLCIAAAVLMMLPGLSALAQFESASVLGYVRDASDAAVPNATVTLTNMATGIAQTKTTDGEGKYEFPSVQIGNYQILASAQGFDKARTETFNVQT